LACSSKELNSSSSSGVIEKFLSVRREGAAQSFPRAVEAGLESAHVSAHDGGGLVERQVFEFAQDDGFALEGREGRDGRLHELG
jgi:hypothetical protein